MVSLEGTITVAEAARRLNRSIEQVRRYLREGKLMGQRVGGRWFVTEAGIEQVRRYLREGKLRGQRIGGQWFVEEAPLAARQDEPLVPQELVERIQRRREAIRKRIGHDLDVVDLIRRSREGH